MQQISLDAEDKPTEDLSSAHRPNNEMVAPQAPIEHAPKSQETEMVAPPTPAEHAAAPEPHDTKMVDRRKPIEHAAAREPRVSPAMLRMRPGLGLMWGTFIGMLTGIATGLLMTAFGYLYLSIASEEFSPDFVSPDLMVNGATSGLLGIALITGIVGAPLGAIAGFFIGLFRAEGGAPIAGAVITLTIASLLAYVLLAGPVLPAYTWLMLVPGIPAFGLLGAGAGTWFSKMLRRWDIPRTQHAI